MGRKISTRFCQDLYICLVWHKVKRKRGSLMIEETISMYRKYLFFPRHGLRLLQFVQSTQHNIHTHVNIVLHSHLYTITHNTQTCTPRRIYIYIGIYIFIYLRGAFNMFPDFFVQAFKIVADSWKFIMLLLYILWDNWPGLNEQLQQQLEYTLLKPVCQSWRISKNAIWTWGHFRRTICYKILF